MTLPPQFSRLTLPPSPAILAAIALAFVLPGLAGHDPWKTHDVLGVSIVHGMAVTGDYLVPRVAGLLWLPDPPLYHWLALAFGRSFDWVLPFHAAARLASGVFVLAALGLIYVAARDWSHIDERRTTAAAAPLILLGSVGLMVHAHEALPELAQLAALCGALAALPLAPARPALGGVVFGVALGCAFLSSSWIPPAALGITVIAAHLACDAWRKPAALLFLGIAVPVSLAIGATWPVALSLRSAELHSAWWSLVSQPQDAALRNLEYFVSTGGWFTWPAWPLGLWSLWALRRRLDEPRLFVPTVTSLAILACIGYWGPREDVNLIPLLAPLALLASQGVPFLRRGAAAALDWFGVITFAFFASLVWLGYSGMMTGVPPKVASNFARAAPGFVAHFDLLALVIALALSAGWLYVALFTSPAPSRSVTRWAGGIVLLWGTFAMLWMPWADYQKSYRAVAAELRRHIPAGSGCVAQRFLGLSQGAALDYHAGIRPRAFDPQHPEACRLLLIQGTPGAEYGLPGGNWRKIAEAGRPGDRGERYRLYRLAR